MTLRVRPAAGGDDEAIWSLLSPMLVEGETYTLPSDMSRQDALGYWRAPANAVFVGELDGEIVGTYYLRRNQLGGGAHVANCGYVVGGRAQGRGVAREMCLHSIAVAKEKGFRAMQFNFVISTNTRAVELWKSLGFGIVGVLHKAFAHPRLGFVDAFVMFRSLVDGEHQPSSFDQLRAVT